ncbi:polyprenyl synthetase family protein [Aerococcaceae bacterium WGS1372]
MVHNIWHNFPPINKAIIETKELMKADLSIQIPEIEEKIIEYIDAPGKYLRAGMVLMFYYLEKGLINKEAINLAASVELFHLATLIHDDVIDLAPTRRGIETIDSVHGNKIAIYAGDYLLSYSGRLAAELNHKKNISAQNARMMESVMRGELNQLINTFNKNMTMMDYLRQIRGKTAMLFALSTFSGYYLASSHLRKSRTAKLVGLNLGMAFQLQDDLIDYKQSQSISGKPRGQDIQNGIYTAPLIIARDNNSEIKKLMNNTENWTQERLEYLDSLIIEAGGYEETQLVVNRYINKALNYLNRLSQNEFKYSIEQLVSFISHRES